MASRTKINYRGVGQLLRSPEVLSAMVMIAEEIKGLAEPTAPVGIPPEDGHPGQYKESFRVEATSRGGFNNDRAQAKVINDAPHAFYVEYGSEKVQKYRTLGAAAEAVKASYGL